MSSPTDDQLMRGQRWPFATRVRAVWAACLVSTVPFLYVSFLVAAAWLLVVGGAMNAFERWVMQTGWDWRNLATCLGLAVCGVTWVWMFRPFWVRREKPKATRPLRPLDQPELFEAVRMAVAQAKAPEPVEVCLNAGGSVRIESAGKLGGLFLQYRLVLGTGWIGACEEGKLIADLTAVLTSTQQGLGGQAYWVVRGLEQWLELAAAKPEPASHSAEKGGELASVMPSFANKRPKRLRLADTRGWQAYLWVTRRPIWLMLQLARAVSAPAMSAIVRAGDMAAARLIGGGTYAEVLRLKARVAIAEAAVAEALDGGLNAGRLPDNMTLQLLRQVEQTPAVVEGGAGTAEVERRIKHLEKLGQKDNSAPLIERGGSASGLVRQYQELCRQMTQMHYQSDLGIAVQQIRLVAVGDTGEQDKQDAVRQPDIERYFQGLAHPDRPLWGLEPQAGEGAAAASSEECQREMARCVEAMAKFGSQLRSLQREWSQSWQRCRDLEMGHAFALAGMPMDARQYGLHAHQPGLYREEIQRQEVGMEFADEAMKPHEAVLERRLAAALGWLMAVDQRELGATPDLLSAREQLPVWGVAYGTLSEKLPMIWRLLSLTKALEALGLDADSSAFKHAGASGEMEAQRQALDYLHPEISRLLSLVLLGLDQTVSPMDPEVSLGDWLKGGGEFLSVSTPEEAVADGKRALLLTERFIGLNREALAWLCRTAEAAEALALGSAGPEAKVSEAPLHQAGVMMSGQPLAALT